MGNLLYIIAVLLVVGWLIGLGFHAGGLIHLLLVIALVVVVIRLIQGRSTI
ncbi:lmo0937 family membrane protein [Solitalea sp. MAHUQ-68]|uniref:Lmo0937 family membrane protein n=1 Tax=Solitalea agri TaxID=2953739 RepID=A0A9X2EZQ5_9SPHI|nr:lmo0937 family membrane protein [Solitalea agri]MCO4291465.1 lmo0937 family membrane protein [Solitalea agri]